MTSPHKMSLKDKGSGRSKIPRFIGTGNKNGQTRGAFTDSKVKPQHQRSDLLLGPKCRRRLLEETATKMQEKEMDDIQFEPDPQALESILNNEGIKPCPAVRASAVTPMSKKISVFNHPSTTRMSMWESHTAFKQSLKLLREKLPQSARDISDGSKTPSNVSKDPTADTIIGSGKRSSIYYQPSGNRTSLMQSYLEHRENMKIFREKMQQISTVSETPHKKGPVGGRTPSHHPRKLVQSTTKNGGTVVKTPTTFSTKGYQENRTALSATTHREKSRATVFRPLQHKNSKTAVSTTVQSKNKNAALTPQRVYESDIVLSKQEVRPLHVTRTESNSVPRSEIINRDYTVGKVSVIPPHSVYELSAQVHVGHYENKIKDEARSCSGKEQLSYVSTNDVTPRTMCNFSCSQQTLSGNSNILPVKSSYVVTPGMESSTECTWSGQNIICTPSQIQPGSLPSFSSQQRTVAYTVSGNRAFSSPLCVQLPLTSSLSTPLTQTSESFHPSFQTFTSRSTPPVSPLDDVLRNFNEMTVSSVQTSSQDSCLSLLPKPAVENKTPTESVTSSWPATPTSAPLRVKSAFTPVSHPSRITVQDCPSPAPSRSPLTPMTWTFLNQPPRRTPALSSCLKTKTGDKLPVRNALSSVKKLRWADAESPITKS